MRFVFPLLEEAGESESRGGGVSSVAGEKGWEQGGASRRGFAARICENASIDVSLR